MIGPGKSRFSKVTFRGMKTYSEGKIIELNKKRRDTKLIARHFEDILSSLSSDRKNSVLKFKGANIQYVNFHEQFRS